MTAFFVFYNITIFLFEFATEFVRPLGNSLHSKYRIQDANIAKKGS